MQEYHIAASLAACARYALLEPFGERLWELAYDVGWHDVICIVSTQNYGTRWRGYFESLPSGHEKRKHVPKKDGYVNKGKLSVLPYIPLSHMGELTCIS